jgi:hypothetical protein
MYHPRHQSIGTNDMDQHDSPTTPLAPAGAHPWLLLIHQVPAKPDYLRVKVWRRLQRLGAAALKKSVWVLPRDADALEDFQWLLKEIVADGGDAMLCEAGFLAGLTAAQEAVLARLERGGRPTRRAAAAAEPAGTTSPAATAPASASAAEAPATRSPAGTPTPGESSGTAALRGRVWVTRRGVHVDRIASAWLIRRFIDAEARFDLAEESGYRPRAGELRFDMFEGEFTHEGDRCTFEVLAARFAPADAALARIGELVHDVDYKDGKFGAAEVPGFAHMIEGICARYAADADRLERGAALLDDLYAAFAMDSGEPGDSA